MAFDEDMQQCWEGLGPTWQAAWRSALLEMIEDFAGGMGIGDVGDDAELSTAQGKSVVSILKARLSRWARESRAVGGSVRAAGWRFKWPVWLKIRSGGGLAAGKSDHTHHRIDRVRQFP